MNANNADRLEELVARYRHDHMAADVRWLIEKLKDEQHEHQLTWGCLEMVREDLVSFFGEDHMKGVPPMMYNDAIRNIIAQRNRLLRSERDLSESCDYWRLKYEALEAASKAAVL